MLEYFVIHSESYNMNCALCGRTLTGGVEDTVRDLVTLAQQHMEAVHARLRRCLNCNKPIEQIITRDSFETIQWRHLDTNKTTCDIPVEAVPQKGFIIGETI